MNRPPPILGRAVRHVHLLGAGGMGMTPLGLYLRQRGFHVSAEDDAWNPATRALLEPAGVTVTDPCGVPAGTGLIVYSPAVSDTHPARMAAAARGLPQIRRGDMLAEVTQDRRLIAVVGSHGKTTTTAMLVWALHRAGLECGWLLGGLFAGTEPLPPARDAEGWVVAEIDESDGTIGRFSPEITLAVSLDWDHADRYATATELEEEFAALLGRTRTAIFLQRDNPMSASLVLRVGYAARLHTFGAGGDYSGRVLREGPAGQTLQLEGAFPGQEMELGARGAFNAGNALGALAVAAHLGAKLAPGLLADFPGVRRRQTLLHAEPDLTVFEDYAHHPAEIRALLAALRPAAGRLVVVFQPHRYTRTLRFKEEFARELAAADLAYLLDVYPASEPPLAGGTTADLVAAGGEAIAAGRLRHLEGDWERTARALQADSRPGDTLVFVGAGDIDARAREFLAARAARASAWNDFLASVRPRLSPATRLTEREPLGPKTTMRVGGPARVLAEPANADDLQVLLAEAHARGLPVFPLGRGSNLLVPDAGVDGLVIALVHPQWQEFTPQPDGRVWAGAGLRLKNLCGLATKAGLQGFEFMEGIPATVGGALRMNAGAMGGWTFDVVDEVHFMTLAGERRVMAKAAMQVDYRHCEELVEAVALGAFLRPASHADAANIRAQMESYQRRRQETQPREPSAGCIFKNPPGDSAGRLIDSCGLKGERVGDAEVSPVHANFIVNRGAATCDDILALVRKVRAVVRAKSGVVLQPEVMLFGRDWGDVL